MKTKKEIGEKTVRRDRKKNADLRDVRVYTCTLVDIYIYIYTCREKERERENRETEGKRDREAG